MAERPEDWWEQFLVSIGYYQLTRRQKEQVDALKGEIEDTRARMIAALELVDDPVKKAVSLGLGPFAPIFEAFTGGGGYLSHFAIPFFGISPTFGFALFLWLIGGALKGPGIDLSKAVSGEENNAEEGEGS